MLIPRKNFLYHVRFLIYGVHSATLLKNLISRAGKRSSEFDVTGRETSDEIPPRSAKEPFYEKNVLIDQTRRED